MKITISNNILCYRFREINDGITWADIYIDASGNQGSVLIQSDYGSWNYYWSRCAVPFKQFLTEIETEQLMRKLTIETGKEFDEDKFFYKMEQELRDMRHEKEITPEEYSKACNEVEDIKELYANRDTIINHIEEHCVEIAKAYIDREYPDAQEYPFLLQRFVKEVWPAFIEQLKTEISQPV